MLIALRSVMVILLLTIPALNNYAQQILWQETFDINPFGDDPFENWTTEDAISSGLFPWEWTSDGQAANGTYWNNRPPIKSISQDGAITFDSDAYAGNFGTPQFGIVTSPLILLPPGTSFFLEFFQYYRNFESFTRVEIRNIETGELIEIFNNELIGPNVETASNDRIVIELTDLIPPGIPFQLQFTFEGAYYFWLIDDITIYDSYPYPTTFPAYIGDSLAAFQKPFDVDSMGGPFFQKQLVVQFKPGTSESDKQDLRDSLGVSDVESCMCDQLELWTLGNPLPFDTSAMLSPNGPSIGIDQIKATASSSSKVDGVDLNRYNWNELQQATDTIYGPISTPTNNPVSSGGVRIAILDTGIDYEHPDLEDFIWKEGPEDSFNCLPGDTVGWNFVNDNNNPFDNHSHGTHLAGIVKQNLLDSTNCQNFEIMAVKTHDENGVSDLFDVACGMYYALQHDAAVINCSWGWLGDSSEILNLVVDSARISYNAVIVAATGNDTINLSQTQQFPACTTQDNVIAVTSVNNTGQALSPFANFSSSFTDVGAPGENIISTRPRGGFWEKSGTSMAAPAVAAAAAAVYCSTDQPVTYPEVIDCVLGSASEQSALQEVISQGLVLDLSLSNCIFVPNTMVNVSTLKVQVAPNPTASLANLMFTDQPKGELKLLVFNPLGQIIQEQHIENFSSGTSIPIDLSPWPNGLYVVKINSDREDVALPLLKQ